MGRRLSATPRPALPMGSVVVGVVHSLGRRAGVGEFEPVGIVRVGDCGTAAGVNFRDDDARRVDAEIVAAVDQAGETDPEA